MRKRTKIALAAGALVLAGAAGLSTLAVADYRGSHGGKYDKAGYGAHHRGHHGWGRHGDWHGKQRFGGWGMNRLFERFDMNNDGKLTQEEVDEARTALLAKHDTDKDGKLTLAEFEKLWLEVMYRRMVRGFQRIDQDGDAALTVNEFLKPFSKVVEHMDRNDDGALDNEDRAYRGWHHKGDDDDHPRGPGRMGPRG
jgi:hypothetical protein